MSDGSSAHIAITDDESTVPDEIEYEEKATEDPHEFVLAPTPAQLGKAPLQRRLGSLGSISGECDETGFCLE